MSNLNIFTTLNIQQTKIEKMPNNYNTSPRMKYETIEEILDEFTTNKEELNDLDRIHVSALDDIA
jgi:hypothetical protein